MSDFAKLLEAYLDNPPAAPPGASRTVKREDGTVVTLNVRNPLVAGWPEPHEEKEEAKEPAPVPRTAPRR
jgi:hypothetical protein